MNQEQLFWSGSGGDAYTTRSKQFKNYEFKDGFRFDFIKRILFNVHKDSSVLELGCNSGNFIGFLKELGFKNITGVEINKLAYETCRQKHPDCEIINSSIEGFESDDKWDMVVTSGVLIHILDVKQVIQKMENLSRKYIFGNEYYSPSSYLVNWPSYCCCADYANMFETKPKIDEVHETKDGELHSFYLIEK